MILNAISCTLSIVSTLLGFLVISTFATSGFVTSPPDVLFPLDVLPPVVLFPPDVFPPEVLPPLVLFPPDVFPPLVLFPVVFPPVVSCFM